MKKHRVFYLFILIFCHLLTLTVDSFRFNRQSEEQVFEFTSPLYNLSVEENSVGTKYARSDNSTKIGVPLPEKDATCKFRVAEVVGEKSSLFKAHSRQVGDFVFLRIRYKGDNPLNRELKEFYDMLVKATCKRRDSSNLETTARIHLRVIDRNDASPVFLVDEQGYEATIEDTIEPFSKVLQVEASDADIGINSHIYFSMLNRSHDFFVEPVTGWIRTLRPLKSGKYEMKVKSEDRASRLFYFDENEVQPSWTADVAITVTETKKKQTKILVEKRKIDRKITEKRQLAAILTLKDSMENVSVGLDQNEMGSHLFEVEKGTENDEQWMLYTTKGQRIPNGSNVTVTVGYDFLPISMTTRRKDVANVTAVIQIEHLIEHSIGFDENMEKVRFEVEEIAPFGRILRRIEAKISNEDDRGLIRYSIRPKVESGNSTTLKFPFSIGSKNGILRVSSRLNYHIERNYEFDVIAQLDGLNSLNATSTTTVEVLDGNDHSPMWAVKWLRQAPIAISEKKNIAGSILLKVDAQDRDEGDNGRVVYKMASEVANSFMTIDSDSGEISLISPLPKAENNWQVTIWAVDWGSPLSRASALNLVFYRNGTKIPAKPKPVVIQEAENLKSPIFESFPDVVEVLEDAPVGTIVAKLRATDEDTGYNGLVRYVIHDMANLADEVLAVNETSGEVTVASSLEKLIKEGKSEVEVQVKVTAEDAGNPSRKAEKVLKLRILDVNNHSPQFDQPWYRLHVSEDAPRGKELVKITATDSDGKENGQIKYSISSYRDANDDDERIIEIDAKSGVVKLRKQLDREMQDVMSFTIMAIDSGVPPLSSFVNLTISIDDVNDNAPRCVRKISKSRIPEDYPHGAFVTCIAANDLDLGQNARIRYTIDNPDAHKLPFRIDHHIGCVFVHVPDQPLDFHRTPFFNLSIDVADNGEQVLSTSCELHIELIDIAHNHLAIEFDDVAKEASVYENSPIGTDVIILEAKEIADEKRKVENVRYSIIGGDGRPFFNIDDKGTVRTSISLDREFKSAHWLTIEARDGAIDSGKMRGGSSSRRRAVVHVYVRVLDRNDHRPQPRQPVYFASVKENSPANVVIVKIEATDADDVGNDAAPPLQFKIERGDPQSFFRIDPSSGYMTTSGSRRLDREKQAEHELWVSICDGGEPQLCSQVAVILAVEDENDNAPAFTQPIHHYNVRARFSGPICRIFAVDLDDGDNSKLFYNVTEGDSRFSIDENGIISTSQPIHGDESYALTIQATDRGNPPQYAATRVVLTAIGGNKVASKTKNNSPIIAGKKSDYVIPISDADQVGLTIGKLEATDSDGDDLWWNISSGDELFNFDVRKDNGQLLLAKKIDNLKRGELRLNISVTDGIDSDYTTVIIQVARSATHRPKFSASHYQTDISEKTSVGTQVYTLKANGEDIGPGTKPLVYSVFSIEDVAMEEKIRVEPSSGNVIVMESLDFETSRQIRAIVQVRQANLKNFATLIVNVNDENDNGPKFVESNMIAFVDESDPIGSLITTVTAFDADIGENGLVSYSIISGNEAGMFDIDKQSGEVRLEKKIDRDEHVETILRIRATDGAKYSLSDEMTLSIRNSNATIDLKVKFYKKVHQITVDDSTSPGTPLTVLTAQHHGSVRYGIVGSCPYFEVHPLSGAIHLAKWLTRERGKSVNCSVRVETGDEESDEAKVVIKIRRTNQYSPVFRQQVYTAQIRENSPIGSPVLLDDSSPLILSATDNDSGPNALIGYRIISPGDDYFVVDLISGAVRVRKPIDYEKVKEWKFHVQAFDMGQPPRSSPMPALVIVSVVDENDEPPKFSSDVFHSRPLLIPTADGIRVGTQLAEDGDTVGRIRYFMKDEEAKKVFGVNSTSGVVFVKKADLLEEKEYKFDIYASDGIRSTFYQMIVNSQASTGSTQGLHFTQSNYTATILENTTYPVGKTLLSVTAVSGNKGMGDSVVYSIVNERNEFSIHPGTGVIILTGVAVDREVEPEIRLVVQARSTANLEVAQTTVLITVLDINDEAPFFLNLPYDVAISVDSKIGDHIISIKATDKDDPNTPNSKVKYHSKDIPIQFSMSNGKISLAKKVDIGVFEFEVTAEDSGKPSLKSVEKVKIKVVDKAQPVFEKQNYQVVVSNEVKRSEPIIKVKAKSSIGSGDRIGYKILNQNDGSFDIDWESGEIRVLKKLNKPEYSLQIEALEVTRPKLKATAVVTIRVKSKKVDAPIFAKKEYLMNVLESTAIGQKIMEVEAKSDNGDVSYAIKGHDSNAFLIDTDTGEIRLGKTLDFETKQTYKFMVVASDRRQIQSEADIIINVDDVNDEQPKFVTSFASAQVDDAAIPGQFVTILSVTDLDTVSSLKMDKLDENQKLLFKIVDGDETLFDINSKSGEVTLARFIEEEDMIEGIEKMEKNLNVSVSDGIFTSYAQLSVEVKKSGKRQLPPRFEQSQYIASALENTAVNKSALLTVIARDGIAPIRYSLGPASSSNSGKGAWPVRVDKTSGRIHVARVLNYHNDKLYHIPLVAEDVVGRRAFATLTLSVIDINDKPPVFVLSSYACSMSESAKEGDTVLMVSATDDDENDMIEYSLIDESDVSLFNVHPKQGTVTVAKKLEHKAGQTFSLTVKATDSANPPHHATTTVEVNIASDRTPVPRFSNSHYLFSVAEDAAIGNVIGRVQQVDTEVDEVRFAIAEAASDLPFSVERSTGKIIVKSGLDRERKAQWRMAVRVDAAGGVHAITTITVDIADVNDNSPAFQGDYEKLTISEDAPVGTSVAIFSATDKDEAPSGKIRFSLIDSIAQFVMNEDSGWLTIGSGLDREKKDKYEMVARATDEGGLNTDLKFVVSVTDVNDSPPLFDKSSYSIDIDPASIPASILSIIITDADLPPNNESKLFISSGNEEGIFGIDGSNLKVQRPEMLKHLKKDVHRLVLTAFDGVFARNVDVVINVKQMKPITCPPASLSISSVENSKKGTVVLEESPVLKQVGLNNVELIFGMKNDDVENLPFVINFRNGIVKIKELIDFEKNDSLSFIRTTMNKQTKEIICEESIEIQIVDENDNRPILTKKVYDVTIKENLKADEEERQYLTRIEANDADVLDKLKYRLVDGFGVFMVDEENGVVTVVKMLDREEKGDYVLEFVVSDGKNEEKGTIRVSVADQNDNPPNFEKKIYSMKVMESESVGYELVRIRADGGDQGETVEFSLKKSKNSGLVTLDKKTGVMKLAKGLDFEKEKVVELTVEAIDSGNPPLKSEAKIEIVVMDENDNVPMFDKPKYTAKVVENAKIGTKLVQVKAKDEDSEHFGTVSYSIVPAKDDKKERIPFIIDESGWILVNGSIDYESNQRFLIQVQAKDGGLPALSSTSDVEIEVQDENDNSPIFEDCNMTAVVQESAQIGHIVLNMAVTDLDGEGNSGPFKMEIKGDGSKSFKFDKLNLITAAKLQHSKKDRYLLTVIAKDLKGRSTDCPLTVWVKEESRHAPTMKPLRIRVNTLQNELQAGVLGRLKAEDQDAEDLLRFGILEDSIRGPLPTPENPRPSGKPHIFRVDPNTGDVWAEHSIPVGLHTFNVTVTDGKFNTASYVEIHVISIDGDVIEHAVAVRIRSMNVDQFMSKYEAKFRKVLAAHLNVHEESIQLISIQDVEGEGEGHRSRRSTKEGDVEILLTAQRGHGRGYLKPDQLYSRFKQDFQSIQDQSDGMRYQLITEMCTTGVCQRGECRERIELVEDKWTKSSIDDVAFVSPYHTRSAQCLCPDGFGGKRCELEINKCSRTPCNNWQMCVPSATSSGDNSAGFECVCPLGMDGPRCEKPSCDNDGRCLEEAELSVGGDGYFEMSLSNEVETRMELEIEVRTTSTNGVIMWAAANKDYHMLSIIDGFVEYTWDAGSGQGLVRSKIAISDGKWHTVGVSRRQRRTRITVDEVDVQEGFSPVGSTVINLHRYSQKLVFGAKVEEGIEGDKKVSHGISACFKVISVDGRKVPKTRQGMRLFGASPGCSALTSSPCSEMPCGNGGTCVAHGKSFTCMCTSRYSGDRCEIDTEPCASHPCPIGIQCIPFHNDYLCKCPNGFTGKHCESRGFTDSEPSCSSENKCGNGQCISIPRQTLESSDFICNCTGGVLQSTPCRDSVLQMGIFEILLRAEIAIAVGALLFVVLVAIVVCIGCRCCKRNRDPKYGAHCDVPHMRNTRVLMPAVDPPPLPPRGFRNDTGPIVGTNSFMGTVTNTNRPTVQVRPFPTTNHHHQRLDSRSPSVCGSSKGTRREYSSEKGSRRIGLEGIGSEGAGNRVRMSDRRSERNFNEALTNLRDGSTSSEDWRASIDDNISAAIRTCVEGRMVVGATELTPVLNDNDYMTMKPRKNSNFEKGQTISEEDDEAPSSIAPPPKIPAHAAPLPSVLSSKTQNTPEMDKSVLYDDPVSNLHDTDSVSIDDIDDIDEEVRIHIA